MSLEKAVCEMLIKVDNRFPELPSEKREKIIGDLAALNVPKCPNCEEPLAEIHGQDNYHIFFKDGRWYKEEDDSRLVCGKCYGDLDDADVEDIMRAVGLL